MLQGAARPSRGSCTAFGVFVGFRYTDELDGDGIHGLLLEARIGDRSLQGIDLL